MMREPRLLLTRSGKSLNMATSSQSVKLHPCALPAALVISVAVLAGTFFALGWHRFVPILGTWEYFHFFYAFGALDPEVSFVISPRANIGGMGYPLLDIGTSLVNLFGLSLPGFRAISYVYAAITYAAMITVFSRWFGLVPALVGVTLTILSTGYLFFANQVLVLLPTLMLCTLLIAACQRLDRLPGSSLNIFLIGGICALLLIHYGMGRFFALGWLVYFFSARIMAAAITFAQPALIGRYAIRQAGIALTILVTTAAVLLLLNPRNIVMLLHPVTIFFPALGAEIASTPSELLSTAIHNAALIGEMLFPFVSLSSDGIAANFLAGQRGHLLDYWHAPFLILGAIVALRRAFRRADNAWPYLSLHAVTALSFGLAMFSAHYGDSWTISPYRIFVGYIAIAGYMTVGVLWIDERTRHLTRPVRHMAVATGAIAAAIAVVSLTKESAAMLARTENLTSIDSATGRFTPYPETYPYGIREISYLQARYRHLAGLLAPHLTCRDGASMLTLIRLDPAMLLDKGVYPGLHYIRELNDLSPLLALYLSDVGVNTGYIIVYTKGARGYVDQGHGYGGRPRVFSGPIIWQDGKIEYRTAEPIAYDLRGGDAGPEPLVIVTFSEAEADGARALAAAQGWTLTDFGTIDASWLRRQPQTRCANGK